MEHRKKQNPRHILAAGAALVILTGIPSAWGALQRHAAEAYALTQQQTGYSFSILLGAYGLGCALGGLTQDRFGPRPTALAGSLLLCGGMGAAGLLPAGSVWLWDLCFAVPVGLGSACLGPAVLSCAQKWYAHRKGVAAGVIGCATGLSGLVLTGLIWLFTAGPACLWGIRGCFAAWTVLLLPVCLTGSLTLHDPPCPAAAAQAAPKTVRPAQLLRDRNYWYLTAAVALATPAVQLFGPYLVELGQARGLTETQALWMVPLGSVGNAVGRLTMPLCSDRLGRRQTDLWLFAGLAAGSGAFWLARGGWLLPTYAWLCVCYSGLAAVLPAFTADLFGLAHAGTAYGLAALGQTVGSLCFPLAANGWGLAQGRHLLAIGAAAVGFCCIWRIRPAQSCPETDTATEKT